MFVQHRQFRHFEWDWGPQIVAMRTNQNVWDGGGVDEGQTSRKPICRGGGEEGGVSAGNMDLCCDLFVHGCVCASMFVCVLLSLLVHSSRGIRGSTAFPSCAFHTVTAHMSHKTVWLHLTYREEERERKKERKRNELICGSYHVCVICGVQHIPFNWHNRHVFGAVLFLSGRVEGRN